MKSIYSDADYLEAYKQRQRILAGFWAMTGAYLAVCIAMLVYHISLPYGAKQDSITKLVTFVSTGIYFAIMFPYMSIKYGRSRRYCKMLFYLSEGLKLEESNYFYVFREKALQKDHIDVVGCAFETWSKKKQEWLEREVYLDKEKTLPDIESGDYVRYISQSNFLIQYEIIEKHAYEFSEYEEEDEAFEESEELVEESVEENAQEETQEGEEK